MFKGNYFTIGVLGRHVHVEFRSSELVVREFMTNSVSDGGIQLSVVFLIVCVIVLLAKDVIHFDCRSDRYLLLPSVGKWKLHHNGEGHSISKS